MAYLDTNARTTKPTANEAGIPLGRLGLLHGVYSGFVKDAKDVHYDGRLRVWIPELGSAPDQESGWITVSYCSPFAGATNVESTSKTDYKKFESTQTSYGMWMIPPDINNQVMVMFINGDSSKGIWIGSLYNQFVNKMVPGMPADSNNHQYHNTEIPVAEYNKWDKSVTLPDATTKPYEETKFKGLGNQGLIRDKNRGITTSGARRETPSKVFGILTPGPIIDKNVSADKIRRKGGSAFIMDDGDSSEYVQLTTKSGAQIKLDETNGNVYLINRDGTAWVQMDQYGNIDIFGAKDISMRAQRDVNIRADRNINIEAGQNIFMKAAKDTVESTTTFTYDVNNIPKASTIPYWKYKGEGKGEGGNIVMQSLNNWHSTTKNTAYLTVTDNNMQVNIGNALAVTTKKGGQDFNAKMGIKMTTDAAFDLAASTEIRIGAKGILSATGSNGVRICGTTIELGGTTTGDNIEAATAISLGGSTPNITPPNPPMAASPSSPAEVKPQNNKTNILATWADPESKFKRNSETVDTIVSRFATYEPCPEHTSFSESAIVAPPVVLDADDKTYEGSSGAGNNATVAPAASVVPGSNNTAVHADPVSADSFSADVDLVKLKCQLIFHEGRIKKSYVDTMGLLHGGIGHLMRKNEIPLYPKGTPISDQQIETWYTNDSASAIKISQELIGENWGHLSEVRKRAVIDLAFNLGKYRLLSFTKFLAAMQVCNFTAAASELRISIWFGQVKTRGVNIVNMIGQNTDIPYCNKKILG